MPNPQTITTYTLSKRPAELVAHLQKCLMQTSQADVWQLCWLNNDHQPVIGITPKASWTVSIFSNEGGEVDEEKAGINPTKYTITTRQRQLLFNQTSQLLLNQSNHQLSMTEQQTLQTDADWLAELIHYSENVRSENVKSENAKYDDKYNKPSLASNLAKSSKFTGGFMGFIGYDLSATGLSPNHLAIQTANQPLAYLGHYDIWLEQTACQPQSESTFQTTTTWMLKASQGVDADMIQTVRQTLDSLMNCLNQDQDNIKLENFALKSSFIKGGFRGILSNLSPFTLAPSWTFEQYAQAFAKVQSHLYAGDSYQINLTQPWQGMLPNAHALIDYLPKLDANTHAPFAGFVAVDGFELVSCSPELFLTFEPSDDGITLITKPIKGTRPRGQTTDEDNMLKVELRQSEKDRAENVMIVDLLRNDLGRFAKTGSVIVPKLFAIESFSNVHHMVSTVTATLAEDVHPLTALFASLPAGSVTGTPKKRAVELIAEIECQPRGAYCGTLGYLNVGGAGHGTGQWNVLIRTVQKQADGLVSVWAGGGITVGSICEAEYQECLDKVGNLLRVLGDDNDDD